LNQDKTFLTRENGSLHDKAHRSEQKIDRLDSELLESKKTAQKYMDRVINTADDTKQKFEDKFTRELDDIKERHHREIEMTKNNLTDIFEQKVSYFRDGKDDAERRVLRLEQDLKDRSK